MSTLVLANPIAAMGNRPYVLNLLRSLSETDHENQYIVYGNRPSLGLLPRLGENFTVRIVPGFSGGVGRLLQEQVLLPWLVLRDRLDVLHCPTQTIPLVTRILGPRLVLTILDLRYLVDRRNFRWYHLLYRSLMYRPSALLAHRLITISDFTRRAVGHEWKVPGQRITAILLGVGEEFRRAGEHDVEERKRLEDYGVRGPFLLSSANSPHKNPDLVIRAFATLARDLGPEWMLVLLGTRADQPYSKRLRALISEMGVDGQVLLPGHVPDAMVPIFYRHARAYVTLSDYEGFGLTALEAMASGTPVIAANKTALPEVVRDAGLLVDPWDLQGVVGAIRAAVTEPGLRERMIAAGLARARQLSWKTTALKTLSVYDEVLHEVETRVPA